MKEVSNNFHYGNRVIATNLSGNSGSSICFKSSILVVDVEVLKRAGIFSMYGILWRRRVRWLVHVHRIEDSRVPKSILYWAISEGQGREG